MVISDKIYTRSEFEDYAAQHPEAHLELINGRIVEKVTTEQHGAIAGNIIAELRTWKKTNNIQGYYSMEASVKLPDDEKNFRRPDVSFRLTGGEIQSQGALKTVPQFCVEVRSPSNDPATLREKATYFINNGARLVWLVHPERDVVEVYFEDGTFDIFTGDYVLSGGEVLPGFEMSVREIFAV
jgi:Uma2 family endonuclease